MHTGVRTRVRERECPLCHNWSVGGRLLCDCEGAEARAAQREREADEVYGSDQERVLAPADGGFEAGDGYGDPAEAAAAAERAVERRQAEATAGEAGPSELPEFAGGDDSEGDAEAMDGAAPPLPRARRAASAAWRMCRRALCGGRRAALGAARQRPRRRRRRRSWRRSWRRWARSRMTWGWTTSEFRGFRFGCGWLWVPRCALVDVARVGLGRCKSAGTLGVGLGRDWWACGPCAVRGGGWGACG